MHIIFVLGVPLVLAVAALSIRDKKTVGIVNAAAYAAVLCVCAHLLVRTLAGSRPASYLGFVYIDALSAFFMFVTSVVACAAAVYSIGYVASDVNSGAISVRKAGLYYSLFNLFCLSMFAVPAVNNLGMLWVAIEMTTLISAFLVGFYNTKESVEAAWKYIIICSLGIILALLGTILFAYAFSLAKGAGSLNWSDMITASRGMDKGVLKVAFIFILVGYGTKAGLAPMHTWLPDAHSQAVAPISALLSGVLLKTAVYAIIRFGMIVINGAGFAYFSRLMLIFGLASLVVSCAFVLVQKDLKRLLAYSSIEHIGVIALGLSIDSALGIAGALMHIFNHAVTKSLIFFGAGAIVHRYGRHNMKSIRGVISVMPFTGIAMLIGVFALAGFPPFSIFISEMMIVIAAFVKGSYLAASAMLVFLSVIFGAFIYHFGPMLFGAPPAGVPVKGEPLSEKLALIFLLVPVCLTGTILFVMKKDVLWIVQRLF